MLIESDDDAMPGRIVALSLQRGEEQGFLLQHARRVRDLRHIVVVSEASEGKYHCRPRLARSCPRGHGQCKP